MGFNYALTTLVPDFSIKEMESMKRMFRLDLPEFDFDPAYVDFISKYNGVKPVNRYFRTTSGKCLPIDKFLNYGNLDLLTERSQKDLNANVIWTLISDRLNIYLLPFAAVANGDFLCFDYKNGAPPSVVLWVQELSEEDSPYTEPVADTFEEFVCELSSDFSEQ